MEIAEIEPQKAIGLLEFRERVRQFDRVAGVGGAVEPERSGSAALE